jgi:hypothetical protein
MSGMESNGESAGTQGGSEATSMSVTPSDVDMHEGYDQETVAGSGNHSPVVVCINPLGNQSVITSNCDMVGDDSPTPSSSRRPFFRHLPTRVSFLDYLCYFLSC